VSIFLTIVIALPIADLLWWRWADVRLRPVRRARLWRALSALFVGLQLVGFLWVVGGRFVGVRVSLPAVVLATIYLWHLFVLPATVVALAIAGIVKVVRSLIVRRRPAAAPENVGLEPSPVGPSRRQVLAAAAVAVPPLVASGLVTTALSQLDDFRINRLTVPLRDLPPDLDGLTIAHVSDMHLGRFTHGRILARVADATNALGADLVVLTGDLLDFSISDLSGGIDFVRRLDPRSGLFMIEGNHDLFEDRNRFESEIIAAGIPLLLNESRILRLRSIDVQLLGMKWGQGRARGSMYEQHARSTLAQVIRDPGAFPILLAHHPHAFDLAADARVPLTLSGHTHGGQLMLSRTFGAGSLLFKYWSGLYRKQDAARDCALVVSNGVGNWFPLRINAPAEIVHLTLRRG
jgi:predicted MPP superfamily phosphohydrolase